MKYCPNCRKNVPTRTMENTSKEWQIDRFVTLSWINHHCPECNSFIVCERKESDKEETKGPIIICTTF